MKKLRSSQNQKKGRPIGVALRFEQMKVFSRSDRKKRVALQDFDDGDKTKDLKSRVQILLDETINYEKQDFALWPDGKDFLKATQHELCNINARLRKN